MKVEDRIYNGPAGEVEIPLAAMLEDGTRVLYARKGELCEGIPVEIVPSLDEQGDWLLPDGSLPEAATPREARKFSRKDLLEVAKEAGIDVPARATKEQIEELIAELAASGEQDPRDGDDTSGGQDDTTNADGEKE